MSPTGTFKQNVMDLQNKELKSVFKLGLRQGVFICAVWI